MSPLYFPASEGFSSSQKVCFEYLDEGGERNENFSTLFLVCLFFHSFDL